MIDVGRRTYFYSTCKIQQVKLWNKYHVSFNNLIKKWLKKNVYFFQKVHFLTILHVLWRHLRRRRIFKIISG